MADMGAGFRAGDRFSIQYPSRGLEDSLIVTIEEISPSGADMLVRARHGGGRPLLLRASRMVEVVDLQTGEVISHPASWFRRAWLRSVVGPDGTVPLDLAIGALPVEGIGPERGRRIAAAFAGWADFAETVAQAGYERRELAVRLGACPSNGV